MAITNFFTETTGLVGVNPTFSYFETTNTDSEVREVGYLNKLVDQGVVLSEKKTALVIIKPTPSTHEIRLYNIVESGGSWSFTPFFTGGGGGSGWLLDASNSGAGLSFGTSDANGWEYKVNNSTFCLVNGTGFSLWSGGIIFSGKFEVDSTEQVKIQCTGSSVVIAADGFTVGANSSNVDFLGDGTNAFNIGVFEKAQFTGAGTVASNFDITNFSDINITGSVNGDVIVKDFNSISLESGAVQLNVIGSGSIVIGNGSTPVLSLIGAAGAISMTGLPTDDGSGDPKQLYIRTSGGGIGQIVRGV